MLPLTNWILRDSDREPSICRGKIIIMQPMSFFPVNCALSKSRKMPIEDGESKGVLPYGYGIIDMKDVLRAYRGRL
jgi:hypothetical protein